MPTESAGHDALVIKLWGLQASATGDLAVAALVLLLIVILLVKRPLKWW